MESDFAFPVEARRKAEDILVKNKAHYYFQIFSGVSHGFAARGDPSDDTQRTSTLLRRIHAPTSSAFEQVSQKRNVRADFCTGSTGSQLSDALLRAGRI